MRLKDIRLFENVVINDEGHKHYGENGIISDHIKSNNGHVWVSLTGFKKRTKCNIYQIQPFFTAEDVWYNPSIWLRWRYDSEGNNWYSVLSFNKIKSSVTIIKNGWITEISYKELIEDWLWAFKPNNDINETYRFNLDMFNFSEVDMD